MLLLMIRSERSPDEDQSMSSVLPLSIFGKQSPALQHLQLAGVATERFRQSVLAAACSGQVLTQEWRIRHGRIDDGEAALASGRTQVPLGDLAASIRRGTTEVPSNEPSPLPVLRSSSVRPAFFVDLSDARFFIAFDPQKRMRISLPLETS